MLTRYRHLCVGFSFTATRAIDQFEAVDLSFLLFHATTTWVEQYLLDQIDRLLQIHAKVNESPFDSFAFVFFLFQNEHMVIEELLKLFVGEVDAELLEAVELLETKEGKSNETENRGDRQLSLMLLMLLRQSNFANCQFLCLSHRWMGGRTTWEGILLPLEHETIASIVHKLHVMFFTQVRNSLFVLYSFVGLLRLVEISQVSSLSQNLLPTAGSVRCRESDDGRRR